MKIYWQKRQCCYYTSRRKRFRWVWYTKSSNIQKGAYLAKRKQKNK